MPETAPYQKKLDFARSAVLAELGDAVVGMYVMGSITREATPASDLDVVVIFDDFSYNRSIGEIRSRLSRIAARANSASPGHELVLWASKKDHYRTLLPDVSYIRRNLPQSGDRLDAWAGLAKHTLIHYELSSCRLLHGGLDFVMPVQKIPPSEALELFLLSTRTYGEGVAELASENPAVRRSGANHVAKAGLRAAYAVLIREDGTPCDSYRRIIEAAADRFAEPYSSTLSEIYRIKISGGEEEIPLAPVLDLLRHCELRIAGAPRLAFQGLAPGSRGEAFGFDFETLLRREAPVEEYVRFPGFAQNFIHSLYFVVTARELVLRLLRAGVRDANLLDFFFEELAVCTSFAFFSPDGVRIVLGREEREDVELHFGLKFLQDLAPLLTVLTRAYLEQQQEPATPWMPLAEKLGRLGLLVEQLGTVPGLDVDRGLGEVLTRRTGVEGSVQAVEWQCRTLAPVFSERLLDMFSNIGLALYQAGQVEPARRVLESVIHLDNVQEEAAREMQLDDDRRRSFRRKLSSAVQYHAVTLHRQGDLEGARRGYLRSLELDSENYSALDDLAALLLEGEPGESSVRLLSSLLDGFKEKKPEARRQVSNRYMLHALQCKDAGDLGQAETWYLRAIETDPSYEKPYFNLGILSEKSGLPQAAVDLYTRSIGANPDYVNPYINLGFLLERYGNLEGAIALLSEAVRRGIANERVFANLGNCLWLLHRYEAARESYKKALEINENYADALNGMGISLISGHEGTDPRNLAEAAHFFARAFEVDPSFEGARANYESVQRRLNELPR